MNCIRCQSGFTPSQADLEFYKELRIPTPTHCPACREQRRLAWRNERVLYARKCDATGNNILSVFSPDKPFLVYHNDAWYSDNWDPLSYGRDFDFNLSFFEQFEALMKVVPQLALSATGNQNCEYVNQAGWNKNCYLIFEGDYDEGCLYGNNIQECRDSLDMLKGFRCELCYECINCDSCYDLKFSEDSVTCSDSWFLKSCIGCKNCFGCVNLRNKEYYFFNQKCGREEYESKLAALQLEKRGSIENVKKSFRQFVVQCPQKNIHGVQNENSTGDYLSYTQNCHDCYDLLNSQDCAYVTNSRNMKKVHDVTVFGASKGAEYCFDCHEIGEGVRNVLFCDQVWGGVYDTYYSKLCLNGSHDLFGCVGLRRAEYCILNKQYTKEEYETLVLRIIDHMKRTGEWGQFLPAAISPFAYNETLAQEYYPLNQENALEQGFRWKSVENKEPTPRTYGLPESIGDTKDDVLGAVLLCESCNKNYKLIAAELKFYRTMKLPVPVKCQECRHLDRTHLRNPRQLWERTCADCGVEIKTSYAPGRPERVLCEACYLKAVY